jgi:hypothetical protein
MLRGFLSPDGQLAAAQTGHAETELPVTSLMLAHIACKVVNKNQGMLYIEEWSTHGLLLEIIFAWAHLRGHKEEQ